MRVFVSAQIGEKRAVRAVYSMLRSLNADITHDWTLGDDLQDKESDPEEAGRRAAADIRGVVASDVYVLLSDNRKAGKGMYAELGAALALNEVTQKPRVFVVGPMNHRSIFYHHPAVSHCGSAAELRRVLVEMGESASIAS